MSTPFVPRLLARVLMTAFVASSAVTARAAGDDHAVTPAASPAPPAPTSLALDEQARDLFRSQRYPEALAIYQRLRAETRHPTYLRNVGRCHQMMRQPAPAIDAFQAYLREARDLDPGERTEVEGYIAEMRQLELSAPPPAPAPIAAPAAPPASATTTAVGPSAPAPAGEPSIARKWWFWTGVGAVLAATIIIVAASSGQDRLPCPSGAVCP